MSSSDSTTPLFSPSLIPDKIHAALGPGYTCRPLQRGDFARGHLDVLRDLAFVGDIEEGQWLERFDWMRKSEGTYYVVVFVKQGDDGKERIVATATLFVEAKFLYRLAKQGHIEDVAVAKDHQGKKFGVKLLEALSGIAEKVGCYKTILDCSVKNEGFYQKCGYTKAGSEMQLYFDNEAKERGI